jgi:hypothetical protein
MKRTVIALSSLASFAASGLLFYYVEVRGSDGYSYQAPNPWLGFILPGLLLILGFAFLVWACSDNIYNVHEGLVVDHSFTPAHTQPATYIPGTPGNGKTPGTPAVYVPARHVPDDWAIEVKDKEGHSGWLHFGSDVFKEYPIGTYYSEKKESK